MLSEDFILFFRSLRFDPFLFFGSSEVYLYIGITSLCLYNNSENLLFQDGISHKERQTFLYKRQKYAIYRYFIHEAH